MTDQTELEIFHNRLRKLLNIDMWQLVNAGVISSDDMGAWLSFCDNPWRWFIWCSDEQAQRVWAIIERPRTPIPPPEPVMSTQQAEAVRTATQERIDALPELKPITTAVRQLNPDAWPVLPVDCESEHYD